MKTRLYVIAVVVAVLGLSACVKESKIKDRSDAHALFDSIISLTGNYTRKISLAKDSVQWADLCVEFEDSLDKINFSFPADTDLQLSEGQNDTIMSYMKAYIDARDSRIDAILHPVLPTDTTDTVVSAAITL